MGSQLDLDQGGTFRQTQRIYLGPSLGWMDYYNNNILPVTAGGTTTLLLGTTLVLINFAGAVTIQLPSAKGSPAGAQALPGTYLARPITVVDAGGNAGGGGGTQNITVLPAAGETIDGLASVVITVNYGAYVLTPNTPLGGWTLTQ